MHSEQTQLGLGSTSVFVVSGGGRGITAQCVIKLAQRYQCKFILLGRSPLLEVEPAWAVGLTDETLLKKRLLETLQAQGEKPSPRQLQETLNQMLASREIAQTLQQIVVAGGQAEYLAVDVTNLAALEACLPSAIAKLGAVTGIIHGAGNLADKLIEHKSSADFDTVYAAKVQGLENLLRCIPPAQLNHLVLFSSVAGFYGNSGQADYALANEILNKAAFLIKQQHPACRVLALNWGPWEGGMVTPSLKEFFARNQVALISVEAGTQKLVDVLASGESEAVQMVIGSPLKLGVATLQPTLKTYRLHRKLTLAANSFLLDHQIGGNPVLPAICAINWVATACAQLYPGYTFYSAESNKVLKGIIFDATLATEYILELKELPREGEAEIPFEATIWSYNEKNRVVYHYSSRPTLRRQLPSVPVLNNFKLASTEILDGATLYRNGTLFHGLSFQGVQRVLEISPQTLTLECYLPALTAEQQGQYPAQIFNPYAVDVQLQGLLIWTRYYYEAASLPLKIQRVEQYRPLPFNQSFYASLEVQASTEIGLVANVTAHDAAGQVYTIVSGAEVTISKRLNSLFVPATSQNSPLLAV
jgi:NAD(P)-dependent dehydrogenase (short-subunit alcohol dehydrogenase family)